MSSTKKLIESYLIKYLKIKKPALKISEKNMFECPFSHEHSDKSTKPSCRYYTKYGPQIKCFHNDHNKYWTIFDVARKLEKGMEKFSDEDIAEYLIQLLDIQTNEESNQLLAKYSEAGFGLIALAPNSKDPVAGQSWLKNTSHDLNQWKDWVERGLGLGLRLGRESNVCAIDIDSEKTLKQMLDLMGKTLTQSTKRGFHYLYEYESWMDDIKHINFRNKGYDMELRVNNAYVVVAPTIVDNTKRKWNEEKIVKMPDNLKELILSLIDKPKEENTECEKQEVTKLSGDLKGLDGRCNDTFVQLGGILRKKLPVKQTEFALMQFNKLLDSPMPYKDIKSMMWQIGRYTNYDKKELAEQVFNHLNLVEQSTSRDLQASLGYEKKDIEEVLKWLIDEGKVIKKNHIYKPTNVVEWDEDFMKISQPLPFKVPYFDDYARFSNGSMIIIGAKSGQGKTHCACNFLERFVKSGINPYLICTESDSKFGIISATRGLKVGDYRFKVMSDPTTVELEDNAVTVIDWLKAPESDYSKMESVYERLSQQLIKHRGLLIVFAQLKDESKQFYAQDMTKFYASFVAKYLWTPIKNASGEIYDWDSENTYFHTEKMRDSKSNKQYVDIPMFFDMRTKELRLRGK